MLPALQSTQLTAAAPYDEFIKTITKCLNTMRLAGLLMRPEKDEAEARKCETEAKNFL